MAQEQEVIIRPRVASGRVEKQLRQLARRAQKEAAREAARATKEATSRALKADLEAAFGKSSTRTIDAVKKKAVSLSRTLVATGRSHARWTNGAARDARRLERAYDGITSGLGRLGKGAQGAISSLTSLKMLGAGLAGGMVGRGAFDLLIGQNSRLEQAMITFETMLGSKDRARDLVSRVEHFSAVTPFQMDETVETSRRLTRSTKGDIGKNMDLVRLSAGMAAMSPSKTIVDAAEAILDAEMGEFERLKEFGVKVRIREVEKRLGRKANANDLVQEVERKFNEMTGGRDLVQAQSQSAQGRLSTLIDKAKLQLRDVGRTAFESYSRGIGEVSKQLDKSLKDPQFIKDLKELGEGAARLTEKTTELLTKAPAAYREARAFLGQHGDTIKAIGAIWAANRLSGGMLAQGVAAGGRRALFGKGGAAGAAAAGMMPGGVQKVWVVNAGGGSFLGRNSKVGMGAAAGSTARAKWMASLGLSSPVASVGSVGSTMFSGGLLGTAAGASVAGGAAALVGSLWALHDVTSRTGAIIKKYEDAEKERVERIKRELEAGPNKGKIGAREMMLYKENLNFGGLSEKLRAGDFAGAKGAIYKALGGPRARLKTPEQQRTLEQINAILLREGAGKLEIGEGRRISSGRFIAGKGALDEERQAFLASLPQLSKLLTANPELAKDQRVRRDNERAAGLQRMLGMMEENSRALNDARANYANITIVVSDTGDPQANARATQQMLDDYYKQVNRSQDLAGAGQ